MTAPVTPHALTESCLFCHGLGSYEQACRHCRPAVLAPALAPCEQLAQEHARMRMALEDVSLRIQSGCKTWQDGEACQECLNCIYANELRSVLPPAPAEKGQP